MTRHSAGPVLLVRLFNVDAKNYKLTETLMQAKTLTSVRLRCLNKDADQHPAPYNRSPRTLSRHKQVHVRVTIAAPMLL